jgi:hypothetical protein
VPAPAVVWRLGDLFVDEAGVAPRLSQYPRV